MEAFIKTKDLIQKLSHYNPESTILLGIQNGDTMMMGMLKEIDYTPEDGYGSENIVLVA